MELAQSYEITIGIGGHPILLRTKDGRFRQLLADRYAGFISSSQAPKFEFDVDVLATPPQPSDQDIHVEKRGPVWRMQRGDFLAQWDAMRGRGRIQQTANPYSIDSVLRIVHSLILARERGFLLHAASVIRNGRAFLFSGVSGAGKTTISRLAPPDATFLTDEISYIRRENNCYYACGTPFSGELQRSGENCSAPVRTLFFLEHGPENKIETTSQAEALRRLLRNTLFFAEDEDLVKNIFQAAGEFLDHVPAQKLTFLPDSRVWSMIQ